MKPAQVRTVPNTVLDWLRIRLLLSLSFVGIFIRVCVDFLTNFLYVESPSNECLIKESDNERSG